MKMFICYFYITITNIKCQLNKKGYWGEKLYDIYTKLQI